MNKFDILECNNIELLKALAIEQDRQLAIVGEILVSESKWHYSPEEAIDKIRKFLVKNQFNLEKDILLRKISEKSE